MNKIVVLNHKMSLLYDDVYPYIERINNLNTDANIIVCPSNMYLEAFVNNCSYPVGAQNVHYSEETNHTGEISTSQLKSLGVEYSIIGHSERVKEFNENKSLVNLKLIGALDANIIPILCFGENIDEDYKKVTPFLTPIPTICVLSENGMMTSISFGAMNGIAFFIGADVPFSRGKMLPLAINEHRSCSLIYLRISRW